MRITAPTRSRCSTRSCPRPAPRPEWGSAARPARGSRPSSKRSACTSSTPGIASPCSRSTRRARSGGSILGDKTRMEQLSRRAEAFIRPSPSGGTLGGVARRTREALLVCEAAGFDVVLVETVGVGQSEVAVAGMVDLFVLLLAPGAGDELQGVKRGIVELADLIVVNKADGDLLDAARHTAADYAHALHLVRSTDDGAIDRVRTCSALLGDGIDELWETIGALVAAARASGELDARRADQARAWMWSEVTDTLLDELRSDAAVRARIDALEEDVRCGRISPAAAAHEGARRISARDDRQACDRSSRSDTPRSEPGACATRARCAAGVRPRGRAVLVRRARLQHRVSRRHDERGDVRAAHESESAHPCRRLRSRGSGLGRGAPTRCRLAGSAGDSRPRRVAGCVGVDGRRARRPFVRLVRVGSRTPAARAIERRARAQGRRGNGGRARARRRAI